MRFQPILYALFMEDILANSYATRLRVRHAIRAD